MVETEHTEHHEKAAIFVEHLTIRNFRGIRKLDLRLQPGLTLLVGRNNAGKSRILRALHVAVGGKQAKRDDLTVGSKGNAEIDVVIAPRAATPPSDSTPLASETKDSGEETFEKSVEQRIGVRIPHISTEPERQRFAWRTTISSISEGTGARSRSLVMTYANGEWNPLVTTTLTTEQRNLFAAELVDAQRDLDTELRRPGSVLRRILNDLNVPEQEREELEDQLAKLGDEIVNQSRTLQEFHKTLKSLKRYMDAMGNTRIDAVPGTLEELARTVGVSFDTGQGQLAARLQGSGARSLASLQVQDLFYRIRLGSDGTSLRPHMVTLIEEPESHLHPHAIFELPNLLENQYRQVVAATHSPQLATVVDPEALRLVRKSSNGDHFVIDFGPAEEEYPDTPRTKRRQFHVPEMEKLKRMVERPFGDLLFARAIVIGDGATERAFLPPVLRDALGHMAHGISVVDSTGMNPNLVEAVIKFSRHVEVPLLVLADNDSAGRKHVNRLLQNNKLDCNQVIWIQGDQNNGNDGVSLAIEQMMIDFDLELCQRACQTNNLPFDTKDIAFKSMKSNKGSMGVAIAEAFVKAYPYTDHRPQWPKSLRELIEWLRRNLSGKREDN